ncbi:semaphorin-2A-like isoform X1 [Dermacentor albipictus]|uniref:semaphorin-2A-like isoform X1 n=2 Tax=Dermacentor albipictus TaxID=60249 RepID=UPI0031FE303C
MMPVAQYQRLSHHSGISLPSQAHQSPNAYDQQQEYGQQLPQGDEHQFYGTPANPVVEPASMRRIQSPLQKEDDAYRPLYVGLALMALLVSAMIGSVLTVVVFLASSSGNIFDATTVEGGATKMPEVLDRLTPAISLLTPSPIPQAMVTLPMKVFTRGKLYYRSGHLDDDRGHLFVGAMDHLFKLRLDNISGQPLQTLHLPAPQKSVENCSALGASQLGKDVDCRNHIREVHPIRDGSTLYVCGTNSRSPSDWQVRAADLTLVPVAEGAVIDGNNVTGKAEGRCSYFVSHENPSLWLDDAPSPGNSSVVALWRFRNGRSAIYRAAIPNTDPTKPGYSFLLTDPADTAKFNEPSAVAALSAGSHAYFVYREYAVERQACGVRLASAIARVCKNDLGGDPAVKSKVSRWTSFMKVRLLCTDYARKAQTAKANFTFDEIRASYWLPDLESGVLLGAFVTFNHGYPDSAVCAFRLEDIERAFNGTSFYELSLSRNSLSKIVRPDSAAYPGTGSACAPDSRTLPPTGPDYLANHPLLAVPPKQRHGRPFFALPGVTFSGVAAMVLKEAWGSWLVCYVATETGLVMKVAEEIIAGGQDPAPAALVDAFNTTTEPIRKMLVSTKHRNLYVFSDADVRQYRLDACKERHLHCPACVRDPFCGWDGTHCLPHVGAPAATTRRAC